MSKRCTQKGHPFVYIDAKDKGGNDLLPPWNFDC